MRVGDHIAVSPGALPRFFERFQEVYGKLGNADWIVSTPPLITGFCGCILIMDGNGRVARLMSDAMLLGALDTGGVWSVSMGLARNVHNTKPYLLTAICLAGTILTDTEA